MVLRNTPKVAKKSKRPRTFQKLEKALDSGLFATYSILSYPAFSESLRKFRQKR